MALNIRRDARFEHYPVGSATVIAKGDMLYYDSTAKTVKPVSGFSYGASLAATQASLKGLFVGVADSRSLAGETDDVRVAIDGVAEFDCASASFEPDQYVGVDDNGAGDTLENQQVIAVANAGLAIGRPVQVKASVTKLLVRFTSDLVAPQTDPQVQATLDDHEARLVVLEP